MQGWSYVLIKGGSSPIWPHEFSLVLGVSMSIFATTDLQGRSQKFNRGG